MSRLQRNRSRWPPEGCSARRRLSLPNVPIKESPGRVHRRRPVAYRCANVGIILGRHTALVVDTGMARPRRKGSGNSKRLAGNRPRYLTLTHFHPEHGFGGRLFKARPKISLHRVRENCARRANLSQACSRPSSRRGRCARGHGSRRPDDVYDEASTAIDLGGRQVELRTWGLAHSRRSVVWLPQEGSCYRDLAEERIFPIFRISTRKTAPSMAAPGRISSPSGVVETRR